MTHFQSKTHIVGWLINNCSRQAICRALNEGQVEFFGGFDLIPPTTRPGWVLRVTSIHGRIWYVAVIVYDHRYGIRILRDVPWDRWVGSQWSGSRWQLYNGDHPGEYQKLKEIWNEKTH